MWSLLLVAAFVVVGLCLGGSPRSGKVSALALLAIAVVLGVQTWSHHLY